MDIILRTGDLLKHGSHLRRFGHFSAHSRHGRVELPDRPAGLFRRFYFIDNRLSRKWDVTKNVTVGTEDQPLASALSDKSMSSRGVDTDIEVVFIHI